MHRFLGTRKSSEKRRKKRRGDDKEGLSWIKWADLLDKGFFYR
jgi:hypothetical protein